MLQARARSLTSSAVNATKPCCFGRSPHSELTSRSSRMSMNCAGRARLQASPISQLVWTRRLRNLGDPLPGGKVREHAISKENNPEPFLSFRKGLGENRSHLIQVQRRRERNTSCNETRTDTVSP